MTMDPGPSGLNIVLATDPDAEASVRTGPLLDVPVAIKDNIATLRMPTSCGSRILEGYVSAYEATVVSRLRAAGARITCKTNMDEFAMGSSTENSAFGPTRNPIDPTRVPGGSSGGSAAAVAAGLAPIALGSETGGSVRQPAAFCGIVGVKPTYGRVSRYGLVAFASSLDQVGVMAKSVDETALGLQIIAGRDPMDATLVDVPVPDYRAAAARPLSSMTIGRPVEYFPSQLDPAIRERCDAVLEGFRRAGATIKDVSLPHTDLAIPVYYIIAPAEASSNLARFDGVRYGLRVSRDALTAMYEATRSDGFGAEVTRRILARHLRPVGRILRRVLQTGAAGPIVDRRGFPKGVRVGRRRVVHADHADPRVSHWRRVRSVRDVSQRHLHVYRQSRRRARDLGPHRRHWRAADRRSDHRAPLRRDRDVRGGLRH